MPDERSTIPAKAPEAAPQLSLQRRRRLLERMDVTIGVLLLAGLVVIVLSEPGNIERRNVYIALMLAAIISIAVGFALNARGHYQVAATVTVLTAAAAPWFSLVADPEVPHTDLVPLAFIVVSIVLSAMLLTPVPTAVIAFAQWFALLGFVLAANQTNFRWALLLALVLFIAVICVLYSGVTQRDLRQIDEQTQQLAAREAELREQSIRDHLTTLFNRRYMEETLDREVERARRRAEPLGLIMIDLDHFKQLNDTMGHAAGDAVLQDVAHTVSRHVRVEDVACRYGGDEFVVILPSVDPKATTQRAEELVRCIRDLDIRLEGGYQPDVNASVGCALYPHDASTGEELLSAADQALYLAKTLGRDRFATLARTHAPSASDLVISPVSDEPSVLGQD